MERENRDDRLAAVEDEFAGYTVYDEHYEKIGKVDDLFVDENDRPEYLGVKMGLLGLKSTLIPWESVRVNERRQLIEVGASLIRSLAAPTSISWRLSFTRHNSHGMRVDLSPRRPIFTPRYSGRSVSSTKRSSTLPIFS